jgi:LPS-assembly lipoprotein
MTESREQRTEKSRNQRTAALFLFSVLCLLLSGCGFSPIYGSHSGSGGPVAEQLSQIAIDSIPDRQGQILRNDLIDRMYGKGRPSQPLYHLSVKLHLNFEDTGILANTTATLTEVNTYGDYELKDLKDKVIVRGTAHSATSYSRLSDEYATLTAHDSAVQRTVDEVSNQIVNRLGLYFANPSPLPGDASKPSTADSSSDTKPAEQK